MKKEQTFKKVTSKNNSIEIALLDERYKTMSEDISQLKKDTKEIKEGLVIINNTIIELPYELTKEFDTRYANKDTELALKRINWILITTIIGALLILILK